MEKAGRYYSITGCVRVLFGYHRGDVSDLRQNCSGNYCR